jgi:hypothetical protein
MKTVEDYKHIRRAFFVEGLSIGAIHWRLGADRKTIREAIADQVSRPNLVWGGTFSFNPKSNSPLLTFSRIDISWN